MLRTVEPVTTAEQGLEAAKFLMQLAEEGRDELGDVATVTPLRIVRDQSGRIEGVIALVEADFDGVEGERELLLA
jgi:hypothetical protein